MQLRHLTPEPYIREFYANDTQRRNKLELLQVLDNHNNFLTLSIWDVLASHSRLVRKWYLDLLGI